jgi:hypothetical protein
LEAASSYVAIIGAVGDAPVDVEGARFGRHHWDRSDEIRTGRREDIVTHINRNPVGVKTAACRKVDDERSIRLQRRRWGDDFKLQIGSDLDPADENLLDPGAGIS